MTPEKQGRFLLLQQRETRHYLGRCLPPFTEGEALELAEFRRELAMAPEVADDPATLFTDEARRPLTTGGDFLEQEKARCCSDALAFGEQLAVKFGKAFAEAALEAALGAVRKR